MSDELKEGGLILVWIEGQGRLGSGPFEPLTQKTRAVLNLISGIYSDPELKEGLEALACSVRWIFTTRQEKKGIKMFKRGHTHTMGIYTMCINLVRYF